MNPKTALRAALIAEIVLIVGVVISSVTMDRLLPAALQDYNDQVFDNPSIVVMLMIGALLIVFFFCWLIGIVGLFCQQRWGAWVFLGYLIAGLLFTPLLGHEVSHFVTAAIENGVMLLDGLIVGLAFFSTALQQQLPRTPESTSGLSRPAPDPDNPYAPPQSDTY